MNYSLIGLGIIIIAWIIQVATISRKNKNLHPAFIWVYVIGVVVLVYDAMMSGLTSLAIANLVCLIVAAIVGIRIAK